MTHRERVNRTFEFQTVDRPALDIMENNIWPSLMGYFREKHGFTEKEQVFSHLDDDFRWLIAGTTDDLLEIENDADGIVETGTFSSSIARPLANASTPGDVDRLYRPDPSKIIIPDLAAAREMWSDHALVYCPVWMPIFSGAANAFGMEEAMINMIMAPELFKAYAEKQTEFCIEVFRRGFEEGAAKYCDFAWIGDDFASGTASMIDPKMWREMVKPYLSRIIRYIRDKGLRVLFHSCGAVREFIPDFIDMGVNALLVVQTTASGMEIEGLARDYGGKIVFFGGIDVQRLLTEGTPEQVAREVEKNCDAFASCGGYVVANCHHSMPDIRGENIEAMCRAARNWKPKVRV